MSNVMQSIFGGLSRRRRAVKLEPVGKGDNVATNDDPSNGIPYAWEVLPAKESCSTSPEQLEALTLSRNLVAEYKRRLANDNPVSVSISIRRSEPSSYAVRNQAKALLAQRGWHLYSENDLQFTLGPDTQSNQLPLTPEDVSTIPDSEGVKALLEAIVFAPRRRQALALARAYTEAYAEALEAGRLDSCGMELNVDGRMHHALLSDINEVLEEKGWHVQQLGASYMLYPRKRSRNVYI